MGDMSDFFNQEIEVQESLRDDYVNGEISAQDAYDHGFLDETGNETGGMQEAWDRSPILTLEGANEALKLAEAQLSVSVPSTRTEAPTGLLNEQAKLNLSKLRPTCNWCGELMRPRDGRYGKFFWCKCTQQSTVSEKYWESVRVR